MQLSCIGSWEHCLACIQCAATYIVPCRVRTEPNQEYIDSLLLSLRLAHYVIVYSWVMVHNWLNPSHKHNTCTSNRSSSYCQNILLQCSDTIEYRLKLGYINALPIILQYSFPLPSSVYDEIIAIVLDGCELSSLQQMYTHKPPVKVPTAWEWGWERQGCNMKMNCSRPTWIWELVSYWSTSTLVLQQSWLVMLENKIYTGVT